MTPETTEYRTGTILLPEREAEREQDLEIDHEGTEPPDDYGRCPVCNKPLRPHDPKTGIPMDVKPGKGFESRAKCTGCGTILYYAGNGRWNILLDSDLTDEDRALDKLKF